MIARITTVLLACVLVFATGCGNSGEKGKNKDKDVPKAGKA